MHHVLRYSFCCRSVGWLQLTDTSDGCRTAGFEFILAPVRSACSTSLIGKDTKIHHLIPIMPFQVSLGADMIADLTRIRTCGSMGHHAGRILALPNSSSMVHSQIRMQKQGEGWVFREERRYMRVSSLFLGDQTEIGRLRTI